MIGLPRQGQGLPAAGHLAVVEHLAVPVRDHLMQQGHPVVAADPVAGEAEAVPKGLSRPAAALDFQTLMVASIAQMTRTRRSARRIATALAPGFRAQSNPDGSESFPAPRAGLRSSLVAPPQHFFADATCHMLVHLFENCLFFPTRKSGGIHPETSIRKHVMSTIRANYSPALLSERLEALASQLAELEQLRDRVDREENRPREPVNSPRARERRCNSANLKLVPLPRWWQVMG